jgi:hypothetical protein
MVEWCYFGNTWYQPQLDAWRLVAISGFLHF